MELRSLKMKRMRWVVIVAALCGMLALFFAGMIQQKQQLSELEKRQQELSAELDDVMRTQREINVQLNEIGSTSTLDSAARAEDFVKPGELRFIIDNSQGILEMYTEEEWKLLMSERELGMY